MSLVARTCATLVVATIGYATTVAPPAYADTAATKAADYVVSTFGKGADRYGDVGAAADALLALVATGDSSHANEIKGLTDYLKTNAADYVKAKASGTTGAAKLAVAAAAVKADAGDFGGVNLIETITKGVAANGSFGSYPGPFASGLAMVALHRNAAPIPEAMVDYLLTYAEPRSNGQGGGFACVPFPFKGDCPAADADNTAMAVLGLQAAGTAKAVGAANDAIEWLKANQQADGSWPGYSPVNSTGLVAPLFPADSEQATKASAYVSGKQLPTGALSTGTDGKANLLATVQGIFALTGRSYATIGQPASSSPPASPAPSEPAPAPAATGPNPTLIAGLVAVVVLVGAGTAFAVNRRGKS